MCVGSLNGGGGGDMKHRGNKLSVTAVRNAKEPGLYGDGHGLYLQISAFNTKSWVFRYTRDGTARKMGMGALHTVTLAEARKRAAAWRLKVHDGVDPIDERRAARGRQKAETAKAITFWQCALKYIEANRAGWKNAKHAGQWVATFNGTRQGKSAHPPATQIINNLPVASIDTALVLKVLEPIWTTTPETASRIRGRIELVLDWAKVRAYRDGENPARWRGHLDKILPARAKVQRVEHHAAVPYVELPEFMSALRGRDGVPARALEFAILTAARTGEIIGARWSEINCEARLWTIPGERMKAGREHRIPLSDRALEILSTLPREGEFVFLGGRGGRPLPDRAMRTLVRSMRGAGDATVHGFRSTFRDWASETTAYSHELGEIALAHAVSTKVEAAYRRGDMMQKRRRLMADWAAYCSSPGNERGNVVAIREAAQ
jgi:integrase